MLKSVLSMERICGMLGYINGQLNDESDDVIDDSQLYFMFVKLAARIKELDNEKYREQILEQAMAQYREPVPGAGERVRQVLKIMLTGYLAARMQQEAGKMLDLIERKEQNEQ